MGAALGDLTYASYLLHFPLQLLLATCCSYLACPIPFRSPILLITYIAGTLLLSRVIFVKFESVARNRIRRSFAL